MGKGSMFFLRAALVVASLVVFGFLAMAVISLLRGDDDGGESVADFLATTTTTTAAAVDAADDGATDDAPTDAGDDATAVDLEAELDAFVDEAIELIESVRGRAFLERPNVELVDVDTMTQIVLDDIVNDLAEDPEAAAASLAFSRAIGFFGPDDEFLDIYNVFVSGGVLGVYFPTSDRLLVRSDGELSLMTKATVVHELVHAFDDQHFDLDRDDAAEDGDGGWTFVAAAEGSATYIEDLWVESLSAGEQSDLTAEELSFDPGDVFSLDFGFLVYQTSPYDYGNAWLRRRIDTEGVAAIDDALVNPPATSEVVIEPLDAPGLERIDVATPEVDGEVLWEGTGGQALVEALTFITDRSGAAARGWGGDAIVVYLDADGNECLRWDLAADSVTDAAELLAGLDDWAGDVGGDGTSLGELGRVGRSAGAAEAALDEAEEGG
ncbi:MAG: hypothetical protein AAGA90_18550, partial [Actinomycetota bacterium]